jgi:hypothetical protein
MTQFWMGVMFSICVAGSVNHLARRQYWMAMFNAVGSMVWIHLAYGLVR